MLDLLTVVFILAGVTFFIAGTAGVLRFPDTYCRLHALTKADNVGLGLIVIALLLQVSSVSEACQLLLIWLLVLLASSAIAHLIARSALREGVKPWREPK